MNCECKKRVEGLLLERLKEHKPKWLQPAVELSGYELSFTKTLDLIMTMGTTFVATGIETLKNGDSKPRKLKQHIVFSFCPFCGLSARPAEKAPATHHESAGQTPAGQEEVK